MICYDKKGGKGKLLSPLIKSINAEKVPQLSFWACNYLKPKTPFDLISI